MMRRRESLNQIDTMIAHCQTSKGARGIPRRYEPMKDVAGCEKPGRAVKHALTPGCPNEETHHGEAMVLHVEYIGM